MLVVSGITRHVCVCVSEGIRQLPRLSHIPRVSRILSAGELINITNRERMEIGEATQWKKKSISSPHILE